jgi:hypothetical protein
MSCAQGILTWEDSVQLTSSSIQNRADLKKKIKEVNRTKLSPSVRLVDLLPLTSQNEGQGNLTLTNPIFLEIIFNGWLPMASIFL